MRGGECSTWCICQLIKVHRKMLNSCYGKAESLRLLLEIESEAFCFCLDLQICRSAIVHQELPAQHPVGGLCCFANFGLSLQP